MASALRVTTLDLDPTERIAFGALKLAQTRAHQLAKLNRPRDGEDWDFGLEDAPSREDLGRDQFAGGISGAAGGNTSARMVGRVAVSVIFVEGPDEDTAIPGGDVLKVALECIDGLDWLSNQMPDANLSYDWTKIIGRSRDTPGIVSPLHHPQSWTRLGIPGIAGRRAQTRHPSGGS